MGEIREEIFSGFCIACNRGQTVTCEFEKKQENWEVLIHELFIKYYVLSVARGGSL